MDCVIDDREYKKGVEVSDEEFKAINIEQRSFHGEWNYTIKPQPIFAWIYISFFAVGASSEAARKNWSKVMRQESGLTTAPYADDNI